MNTKVQIIHSARSFLCVQLPNKTRAHRVQNSNSAGRPQVLWRRHSSTVYVLGSSGCGLAGHGHAGRVGRVNASIL